MSAGYSTTPLVKKLGLKRGMKAALVNAPPHYFDLLGGAPADVAFDRRPTRADYDFMHAFYVWRADYEADFPQLKGQLSKSGMIWISWYKKAAKLPTDISEDVVREVALAGGLVDVKVAAVDAQWSALKLVYRLKDR